MKKKSTGEIVDKWIKINYDYVPKYYKNCKLQGHNEQDCYVIHPELYPKDEEQSLDKEQEENSKADQRKNKEQKNAKNSRSDIKEYKGTNGNIMKGKEIADKVQPAEGNNDDGFKEKKGKQRNNKHFHRGKYDENAWKPKENQTLQNNQYAALQNTDEDIVDVTDVQKSSGVVVKMSDALNQIVTVQQNRLGDVLQEDDDHDRTPISEEEVEDNQGKEGQEGTRPPESNISGIFPVEQVEISQHGKQEEIQAQADFNSQDEEDLAQNIENIAKEADLSPRSVQKLKQATNKQKPVRSTSILVAGVSTRRNEWLGVVISESEQQVTLQLIHSSLNQSVLVLVVYAKCDRLEREELWDDMVDLVNQQDLPWIIGGDFNVIVSDEEKQGGLLVSSNETLDFSTCIQSYGLIDVGFSGSKFTWWNGRTEEDYIFKWLDRILVNQQVLDIMPSTAVTHMIRHGSDQAPLHLECNSNAHPIVKSFKFLNFWTKHHTFMEVVRENWTADFCGNPFNVFHHKLKKLKRELIQWSRSTYGNIFQQIATIKDTIKVKELQFENNASRENRMLLHQAQAELTRFLHLEEEYWKQKAGMKWFNDGDKNTKFFHSYVKGRRNKLTLKRIQYPSVTWLENEVDIASEEIRFFES
ncbi:uncharacterized protein LOC132639554 [Lycium barbarum]|uniref:uncharacterized protein LOC132639554 n=1 Tax=Lycium barbarum TaxID=112863 RepID=UPI00293E7CDC|nr:uncharacterized protein LOC132639554 [Lycium barbarum]